LVGSRYWEIVQIFHEDLQAAIARVTPAILLRSGPFEPGSDGHLYLSVPRAQLNGGDGRHALSIAMRFRVVPFVRGEDDWEIQTFAYSYYLYRDDREFIAYHLDAEGIGTGGVQTPHVHFVKDFPHSGMMKEDRADLESLSSAHMPTGIVLFTDVLRMLTQDLQVEPFCYQGESIEEAMISAERTFAEAEAALRASFDWWSRQFIKTR